MNVCPTSLDADGSSATTQFRCTYVRVATELDVATPPVPRPPRELVRARPAPESARGRPEPNLHPKDIPHECVYCTAVVRTLIWT